MRPRDLLFYFSHFFGLTKRFFLILFRKDRSILVDSESFKGVEDKSIIRNFVNLEFAGRNVFYVRVKNRNYWVRKEKLTYHFQIPINKEEQELIIKVVGFFRKKVYEYNLWDYVTVKTTSALPGRKPVEQPKMVEASFKSIKTPYRPKVKLGSQPLFVAEPKISIEKEELFEELKANTSRYE